MPKTSRIFKKKQYRKSIIFANYICKRKKSRQHKGNKSGVIGIAADLVKYNKKYEQIIFNLLGRTVIVENMDTAIRVAKRKWSKFQNSHTRRRYNKHIRSNNRWSCYEKDSKYIRKRKRNKKTRTRNKKLQENIEKSNKKKQNMSNQ